MVQYTFAMVGENEPYIDAERKKADSSPLSELSEG